MDKQTLIYTETDHKGQWQVIHSADCAEGRLAHNYASGNGYGDQTNWDRYTVTTREEMLNKLAGVYGQEEMEEYIAPNAKWEPCVKIK